MNLNTVVEVKRPASADEITQWRDGYACLAGGTWLFSEPQWTTDTLIDLDQLHWPTLEAPPTEIDHGRGALDWVDPECLRLPGGQDPPRS